MSNQMDQGPSEQKDDALQLEQDLVRLVEEPTPLIHQALAADIYGTADHYTTLLSACTGPIVQVGILTLFINAFSRI